MKKILILTIALFVSLSIFGRPIPNPAVIDKHATDWIINELKEMGYTVLPEVIVQDTLNRQGKKIEYDDLYYQPSKDAPKVKRHKRNNVDQIVDTLVKENPDIQVNYYNEDPFYYSNLISRFYHGGFNYWMYSNPWDYNNWYYGNYFMYDAYDWYWDMRFSGYPYWNYPYYNNIYFGFGYNYWNPWRFNYGWGHNNWYGQHNWYNQHNNFYSHHGFGNYQQPQYGRRERPSNLSNYQNNNKRVAPQQKRHIVPQNRTAYGESRRDYTPSYNNPRMNTRPQYNNSRITDASNRRFESSTQSRTQTSTFNRQSSTQSRTYSAPSRSYSAPTQSRSYNESRSSNYGNMNSGSRSSGSSSFSGGGSSGSRSSGGSSSGRR